MYFPVLELHGWVKRFAVQPQTIYSELPQDVAAVQPSASKSPPDSCFELFEPRLPLSIKTEPTFSGRFCFYGAGDEARTRYLHLGKVALYRMSYTRNEQNAL